MIDEFDMIFYENNFFFIKFYLFILSNSELIIFFINQKIKKKIEVYGLFQGNETNALPL